MCFGLDFDVLEAIKKKEGSFQSGSVRKGGDLTQKIEAVVLNIGTVPTPEPGASNSNCWKLQPHPYLSVLSPVSAQKEQVISSWDHGLKWTLKGPKVGYGDVRVTQCDSTHEGSSLKASRYPVPC